MCKTNFFVLICLYKALAVKGIDYDTKPVHLLEGGGQQACTLLCIIPIIIHKHVFMHELS